jgi:hypothetical protein
MKHCVGGSDQWDAQAIVMRINESLIARRYVTWFDLTNMKGVISTTSMLWSLSRDLCDHLSLESADKSLLHIDVWLHCRQHDGCDERRDRGGRCHVVWREPEIQRELELSNGATPLPLRFDLLQCSHAVDVAALNVTGSKLWPSTGARHDPDHDAEGLLAKGLARSDHGDEAMVSVLGC